MTHAAIGDCERVHAGLVGQPINTVSSGAYLVAAGWLWTRRGRSHSCGRSHSWWSVLLVWLGIGSIGYHGPGDRASKLVHDSALVALAATLACGGWRRPRLPVEVAALGAVATVVHASSRTGSRACRPDTIVQGHAVWHVLTAMALARYAAGDTRQ